MDTIRTKTVTALITEAGIEAGNLAKWPTSEATQRSATDVMKLLRKTFKEDSYPRAFLYLVMLQVAHELYGDILNREIKNEGIKAAWAKIGELLD